MANGDHIEYVIRYMERDSDELPDKVDNLMVLMALRMINDTIKKHTRLLSGDDPDGNGGIVKRLDRLERIVAIAAWMLSPFALAVLGALGVLVVNRLGGQ